MYVLWGYYSPGLAALCEWLTLYQKPMHCCSLTLWKVVLEMQIICAYVALLHRSPTLYALTLRPLEDSMWSMRSFAFTYCWLGFQYQGGICQRRSPSSDTKIVLASTHAKYVVLICRLMSLETYLRTCLSCRAGRRLWLRSREAILHG